MKLYNYQNLASQMLLIIGLNSLINCSGSRSLGMMGNEQVNSRKDLKLEKDKLMLFQYNQDIVDNNIDPKNENLIYKGYFISDDDNDDENAHKFKFSPIYKINLLTKEPKEIGTNNLELTLRYNNIVDSVYYITPKNDRNINPKNFDNNRFCNNELLFPIEISYKDSSHKVKKDTFFNFVYFQNKDVIVIKDPIEDEMIPYFYSETKLCTQIYDKNIKSMLTCLVNKYIQNIVRRWIDIEIFSSIIQGMLTYDKDIILTIIKYIFYKHTDKKMGCIILDRIDGEYKYDLIELISYYTHLVADDEKEDWEANLHSIVSTSKDEKTKILPIKKNDKYEITDLDFEDEIEINDSSEKKSSVLNLNFNAKPKCPNYFPRLNNISDIMSNNIKSKSSEAIVLDNNYIQNKSFSSNSSFTKNNNDNFNLTSSQINDTSTHFVAPPVLPPVYLTNDNDTQHTDNEDGSIEDNFSLGGDDDDDVDDDDDILFYKYHQNISEDNTHSINFIASSKCYSHYINPNFLVSFMCK